MLNIDKNTTLEILLAGAIVTNQLSFVVAYGDRWNTAYTHGSFYAGKTQDTDAVSLLPNLKTNTDFRIIEDINVINEDTADATVIIRAKTDNEYYTVIIVTLSAGETLQYTSGNGWKVLTATGEIKTSASGGGGMVYPGVGIAVSTGASWDTSITDNSTNWDAAYSWVNTNGANAVTAYGWGNHASAGYLTGITSLQVTTALGYTPVTNARTLTINGTTYDLSANRSWTISAGTTYTFSTGLNDNAGTVTSNLSTGVSGGQSVIGGTASGNNLTLSSTSNATKGKILFGTSAYNEVNNYLGVGTASPSANLHVLGTGDSSPIFKIESNTTAHAYPQMFDVVTNDVSSDPSLRFRRAGTGNGDFSFMVSGSSPNYLSIFSSPGGARTYRGQLTIAGNGSGIGIGTTGPTALLHITAGTATANTAPLKFTSGTNLTTAEAGVMEYNNTFHLTNSDATRRHIVTAPNTTKVTAAAPYTNDGYITVNIGGTDFKLMTTA